MAGSPKVAQKVAQRARGEKKYGALFVADGSTWVYRRPYFSAGRWRVRRRHKVTGDLQQVTLEAETKSAAKTEVQELAAAERQDEARDPDAAPSERKEATVKDAMKAWVATLEVRPRTRIGYEYEAEMIAKLLGENRLTSTITFPDVERLFSGHWRTLSGRSKIMRRAFLIRFFDWSADYGYSRGNPARKVKLQRKWSSEASDAAQETGQALTHEEAARLLEKCREPRSVSFRPDVEGKETDHEPPGQLWWFVFLSLRTGLRSSNLLGLTDKKDEKGNVVPGKPALAWKNVDLEAGTLDIPKEHMKANRRLYVPLHREAIRVLKHLRAALLKKNGHLPAPEDRIIPEVTHVRRSFDSALKRAGLDKRERALRVHDLRHSVNTWLEEEASSKSTADLMGHKAKTMTEKYTHHRMEKLRERLDRLPDLTQGAPPPAKREPKKARKTG